MVQPFRIGVKILFYHRNGQNRPFINYDAVLLNYFPQIHSLPRRIHLHLHIQ